MTNLEYLKKVKEMDKERFSDEGKLLDKCLESIEFRKAKAFEIVAEELIKCNEFFAYIKFKGVRIREK